MRKILRIPKEFDPLALITLGFPEKKPQEVKRKMTLEGYYCNNKFNFEFERNNNPKMSITRKYARNVYLNSPKKLKKILRSRVEKRVKKFGN